MLKWKYSLSHLSLVKAKIWKYAFGYFYLVCVSYALQLQGIYFIPSINRCILTCVPCKEKKPKHFLAK